jgi:hypothetical protein
MTTAQQLLESTMSTAATPNVDVKAFESFEVKDADRGEVVAIVATLNVVDRDGDVILPGAIPPGARVKLSGYGHDLVLYGAPPAGKGTLTEEGNKAVLRGNFFMSTDRGREAFYTTKELGPESEWSFGFLKDVKQAKLTDEWRARGARRVIAGLVPLEASPCLLGAGIGTATISAKSARAAAAEAAKQEGLAIFRRNQAFLDALREPQGRLALDVCEKAVRWISRGTVQTPPLVHFFDLAEYNGTKVGFFDPSDPGSIHVARGMSDEDLVETVCHEVSHFLNPHDPGEEIARVDGRYTARAYLESIEGRAILEAHG